MSLSAVKKKRVVYVGGLPDDVDLSILRAAFLTFGEIVDINYPVDYLTQQHKGFAFVEYECSDDAAHAVENMSDSEINGLFSLSFCTFHEQFSYFFSLYRKNHSCEFSKREKVTGKHTTSYLER